MQRKFLEGLQIEGLEGGLPKEVIDSIMNENGKDVETTKTKLNGQIENLQSELKTKEQMIVDANAQIEKFNGLDVEGIKKEAESWKTKFSEFENQTKAEKEAYEKKLQDQQYDFAVRELTGKHKFTNDFVKNAFVEEFKKQGLKLDENGNFLGADDYIKGFQEKNPGVFEIEAPPSNEPQIQQFAAATSTSQAPVKGISLLDAMKAANEGKPVNLDQVGILVNK